MSRIFADWALLLQCVFKRCSTLPVAEAPWAGAAATPAVCCVPPESACESPDASCAVGGPSPRPGAPHPAAPPSSASRGRPLPLRSAWAVRPPRHASTWASCTRPAAPWGRAAEGGSGWRAWARKRQLIIWVKSLCDTNHVLLAIKSPHGQKQSNPGSGWFIADLWRAIISMMNLSCSLSATVQIQQLVYYTLIQSQCRLKDFFIVHIIWAAMTNP